MRTFVTQTPSLKTFKSIGSGLGILFISSTTVGSKGLKFVGSSLRDGTTMKVQWVLKLVLRILTLTQKLWIPSNGRSFAAPVSVREVHGSFCGSDGDWLGSLGGLDTFSTQSRRH